MKYNIWFISCLITFFLVGCFDDKGTYDYENLNEPVWRLAEGQTAVNIECRAGEIAKFKSSPFFTWKGDSAKRAEEVRYEWKLNGVVIGEEADFEIDTYDLMQKINMTKFSTSGMNGTFSIIEKESGIAYMVRVYITIKPTNTSGDWAVLSKKGENSKLSYVKCSTNQETGALEFTLMEDLFFENYKQDIPGAPLALAMSNNSTNIGSLGSVMVITNQVSYDFNCENMLQVGELQDDFPALPGDFKPVDRADNYGSMTTSGVHSFVAMEEGTIYKRQMSQNNLGGDFASVPLVADEKGYKITKFGQTLWGFKNIPCYDEANNRMLTILFYESGESSPFPWLPGGTKYQLSKIATTEPAPGTSTDGWCPVWSLPAGAKVLHASYAGSVQGGGWFTYYDQMNVFYNDGEGNTRWGVYTLDQTTGQTVSYAGNKDVPFPGKKLTKESVILTSGKHDGNKSDYILYANNNEIRYVNKKDNRDYPFITLENATDRVVYMTYTVYWKDYVYLVVGTEQGKLIFYDTREMKENPRVLDEFNLGGSVIAAKELNTYSTGDHY